MTRVLMTADTVGGVWTYALEVTRALRPHGVEVVLATMGPRARPAQRSELERAGVAELYEHDGALEWMDDPWADVERAGDWLLAVERRVRPDVVHLNGYVHAALTWSAPTVVVAHSCVLSWWRAVRDEPAPPAWDEYRARVAAGLRAADVVVAPTAAMLRELDRLYGSTARLEGRSVVIPNCRTSATRPQSKEPFVLGSGRLWDEAKDLAALARAAARISWPVLLAGDRGAGFDTGSARWLGLLGSDELMEVMGRAALYAAPARYEPFGLGILEAALSGAALVVGDIPSLREVWGDAAAYVTPGDDDHLVATLSALIADADRRAALSAAAMARALRYGPERTAGGYLAAYGAAARAATANRRWQPRVELAG